MTLEPGSDSRSNRSPGDAIEAQGGRETAKALALRDLLAILALGALAFGLYDAGFQRRAYGDASGMTQLFVHDPTTLWIHVGYLPAARALTALFPSSDPIHGLKLVSILGGAITVAGTYLLARLLGARALAALLASALMAVTPATWFFATTIEVHTLHSAAVVVCAILTLLAPWRRPALALSMSAALFPLLYLTHQTAPLLGLGWVFLIGVARARKARPFSLRCLLLLVGPLLLVVLIGTMVLAGKLRGESFGSTTAGTWEFLCHSAQSFHPRIIWQAWLFPLGLLIPAALAGLITNPPSVRLAWCLGLLLAPAIVFFNLWGLPERGAYFLATAPFLVVLAARMRLTRPAVSISLGAIAIAAQAYCAHADIARWNAPVPADLIAERVRWIGGALEHHGALLTMEANFPPIHYREKEISEFNLLNSVLDAQRNRRTPEEFSARICALLDLVLADGQPVALDLSYEHLLPRYPLLAPYVVHLKAHLLRHYHTKILDHLRWPLLLVLP